MAAFFPQRVLSASRGAVNHILENGEAVHTV
jgi:hypothetical protein